MLAAQIIFNGQCKEAIELYVKALGADVKTIIQKPGEESFVVHAEILIHGQLLMLNDFGDNAISKSGAYQLSVNFDNAEDLKRAYSVMKAGSTTVSPMQETDYSDCVVRFIDRFDVRWAFWV
jgi:PhnB protein